MKDIMVKGLQIFYLWFQRVIEVRLYMVGQSFYVGFVRIRDCERLQYEDERVKFGFQWRMYNIGDGSRMRYCVKESYMLRVELR